MLRRPASRTAAVDRHYFRSIDFREPGGILLSSTAEPGFTVDGRVEELGTKIILPPWLEQRPAIESRPTLFPIRGPTGRR